MRVNWVLFCGWIQGYFVVDLINRIGTDSGLLPSYEPTETLMYPIEFDEITKLSFYASTVYCPETTVIRSWTCKSCSVNTTFINSFEDTFFGTRGMIVTTPEAIILSFRGTDNIINWMLDFKAILIPFSIIPDKDARVHLGFLKAMNTLAPGFLKELRRLRSNPKFENREIIVVGHSLGGAIAALATILINFEFDLQWENLKLVTYGQPRTGNPSFAHWFNKQPLITARVVYENDIIPHITPSLLDFSHHQNEVHIHNETPEYCTTKYLEDPHCSNRVLPISYSRLDHSGYFNHIDTDGCVPLLPEADVI